MDDEKAYKEELKRNGVELPEDPEEETPEEPEAKKPEDPKEPEKEPEDKAPLQKEPKEQRKRSIYDEYKEKKAEARTEKERADAAERERDELKTKLEALDKAETPREKEEALDDLETFAKEIKADPIALKKMRELFLKDVKPQNNAELETRLARFEAWEKQNAPIIEQQMFDTEFKASLPKLKQLFPNAKDDEMTAIRGELDKLSHMKDWHDKSLAYIAFENQDTLSALVSPKKRGMEQRGRKDGVELDGDFDPNADYAAMTPAQRESWEKQYRDAGNQEKGIKTDSRGKKTLV